MQRLLALRRGFGLRVSGDGRAPRQPTGMSGVFRRPEKQVNILKTNIYVAGGPGFEPRLTESESAVLPIKLFPKMDRGLGFEPRQSVPKTDVLPLN